MDAVITGIVAAGIILITQLAREVLRHRRAAADIQNPNVIRIEFSSYEMREWQRMMRELATIKPDAETDEDAILFLMAETLQKSKDQKAEAVAGRV